MTVSVYLGSSIHCLDKYCTLAYETGSRLAKAGHTIVYGGANVGTMKSLADGAQDAGGEVIGVFPSSFKGTKEVRESGIKVIRDGLSKLIYVKDFAERKKVMEEMSDCCLVLPGSYGTLDELFTYACDYAIGIHSKKIYILNHEGYYSPLRDLLANTQQAGFLKAETISMITFCDSPDDVIRKLAAL